MAIDAASKVLTESVVEITARSWFAALDRKDDLDTVSENFDFEHLYLRFPEGEFRGYEGFVTWYRSAMDSYFDTQHTVHEVDVDLKDDGTADVRVVVTWRASTWTPPAAHSQRVGFDIKQRWSVVADPQGRPLIESYIVEEVQPSAGPQAP